jgi:ketosteroid isomerase-like protein
MEWRVAVTRTIEERLRRLEDEAEIHRLAARFSDAANEQDGEAFMSLWAREGAVWQIGKPLPSRAEGLAAIAALLASLTKIQRYFMQMTHSGVVTLAGDRATARFIMREHGRGDGTFYDNLAVYNDILVREPGGWRFLERHYSYRFLNQQPFSDDAFPARPSA